MTKSLWQMPDQTLKADKQPRQVGVEIELSGIEVDMLARLTALTLRGEVTKVSAAEYLVAIPDQGEYRIEVDFALLKDIAREQHEGGEASSSPLNIAAFEALSAASSLLVPCEIVTPPMDITKIGEPIDKLTNAIRNAGGVGTGHSPFYAFGVHLNVEPPDLEAPTVAAYMKAFVCLFDWLVWDGQVDLSRRASRYIQRYPADYDLLLSDPDYWPDWDGLIADYLEWNASRNRAMDMLPMMMEIDPQKITEIVNDDNVNARPTFHYRLANSMVDEPDWSVGQPWRRWMQIEQLANDTDALNACCTAYRKDRERLLHRVDDSWREMSVQWLKN